MDYQKNKRIAQLIAAETIGILDQDERNELQNWIEENPGNQALYHRIKSSSRYKEWEAGYDPEASENDWNRFHTSVQKQKNRLFLRTVFKYAAIIVLPVLVAAGGYFLILNPSKSAFNKQQAQMIKPGSTKAILTLNDGKSVVIDTPEEMILKEKDGTTIQKSEGTVSYSNQQASRNNEIIYNTITIPRGGEYSLILSDGTKVYLNSVTELKYPVSFQGNVREVELTGEAYFEIAPDQTKPFMVKTGNIRTVALGTVFNINAYKKSEKIATTLVEGKVRMETAGGDRSLMLNPDEQAVYDDVSNTLKVNKVDVVLYTSWKDGVFIFRNESLSDIMEKLSRWYTSDVEFQDPSIKELHFSGSLDRYGDIQPILDIIQSTGKVDMEINQNNIIFKRKN